jgi:hypothetical protein
MAPRHGSVETRANQSTLDFRLAKRRRGKSAMAQNVGIIGTISIAINTSKFSGSKLIRQLHVNQALISCLQPGKRRAAANFIQLEFINFRVRRRK